MHTIPSRRLEASSVHYTMPECSSSSWIQQHILHGWFCRFSHRTSQSTMCWLIFEGAMDASRLKPGILFGEVTTWLSRKTVRTQEFMGRTGNRLQKAWMFKNRAVQCVSIY